MAVALTFWAAPVPGGRVRTRAALTRPTPEQHAAMARFLGKECVRFTREVISALQGGIKYLLRRR